MESLFPFKLDNGVKDIYGFQILNWIYVHSFLAMFVDKDKMKCFATKHTRRVKWLKEHIQDVKIQYGLDDREWDIKGIFIVSKPLISNAIYKQNIKCISRAELCAEIIRNI